MSSASRPFSFRAAVRRLLPALATLLVVACGSTREGGADAAPLLVACDFTNPPFASLDPESGSPVGHDVELAQELAARLGRPLMWVRMDFDQILPAVEAREVDLAIATLGRTEERAQRVAFTRPYYRTEILMLVRGGDAVPEGIDELAGGRYSAGLGTTSAAALAVHGLELAAPTTDKLDATPLDRLLAGELNGIVMDGPDAHDLVRDDPARLAIVAEPLASENYCAAVRPDDEALRVALDEALDALEAEGWLAALDRRHGLAASIDAAD